MNNITKFQVYTGNGKGKTTSSIGLAIRALGNNKKVVIIQFLKYQKSGEETILKKLKNIKIKKFGIKEFLYKENNKLIIKNLNKKDQIKKINELKNKIKKAKEYIYKIIDKQNIDILILDEINLAIYFKLITIKEAKKIINKCKNKIELIFTGRFANKDVIKKADLVTEMKEIKHYYSKNIPARKGIEY